VALKALAGGRLFGHVHGSGPPSILALHGWGRTGSDFDAVLAGTDAIAVDLPGFGASPAPAAATGAHGYADMILDVLESFERPPLVVGHSFGGRVAVALEAEVPGSFSAMVLTGVPLLRRQGGGKPSLGYRLIRAAHRSGLVSDERMEREKRKRGSADYRAASGIMRDVLVTVVNESYEFELSELDLAVALVWGSEDTDVPLWVPEGAAQLLGDRATLEIVDGAGHFIPTTHPAVLRAAIEKLR
jgi:pimeloyl-ACP methyl ester carboxylesterase